MRDLTGQLRYLHVPDRWCVHSYYTLCPYAPDGSDRLLIAGADLAQDRAEVIILDADRNVIDRFGNVPITPSFWHTGLWQCWSPDGRYVYHQSGSLREPRMTRRELATGTEIELVGDMEGLPDTGEPGISCSHGMLYAAGYGQGKYQPDQSPVPFQARDRHGISRITFEPRHEQLVLSTADILQRHPHHDQLAAADEEIRSRLGADDGLTLMTYCVRWNPQGDRFLFYFGNHCVVSERGEPRLAYVFTADRELSDLHLAVDISYDRRGVHWGWCPDGEHLLGYGPHPPPEEEGMCIATVRYDGVGYRKVATHNSGGHPNISPANANLLVTDRHTMPGTIDFIDRRTDTMFAQLRPPRVNGPTEPPGRNRFRVCHHPVFNPAGTRLLINTMQGELATLAEMVPPEVLS